MIREPKRILLSRLRFIGDVVLTTPIIRAVKERYPNASLSYLGEAGTVRLLEGNPHLNEIIPYRYDRPSVLEQLRVVRLLRRMQFDVAIDLFSNPRSAVLIRATGAAIRIGKAAKGRGRFFTHQVEDDGKEKTAVEFHYQYVAPLGVQPGPFHTEVFLTEQERKEGETMLASLGCNRQQPLVGLHPGATWPAKRWHVDRFAEVARTLTERYKCQLVVTQGPQDRNIVERIAELLGRRVMVVPLLDLRKLASVLSHLKVYVTNDNGTMHIAAAVGTTTLGIFGPGEEKIWFPYRPPFYPVDTLHLALRKDVPCHPCHLDFCNRTGDGFMECMQLLPAHEVVEAVRSRL